eukprot:maker-scaffold_18-snap-gene-1.1-mRNA-1 protein AED:0.01 eAED:0.01 QI:14/1/1/1/1/1/4/104/467
MKLAVIALGSNVEKRSLYFSEFLQKIRKESRIKLKNTSYLYYSKPHLNTEQDNFVNAAVEVETSFSPDELLSFLQFHEIGKNKTHRYSPRKLDLDILLFENDLVDNPQLQIPHPRIQERSFVLQPLLDLGYGTSLLPGTDMTFSDLARKISLKEDPTACTRSSELVTKYSDVPKLFENTFLCPLLMGILNLTPDSFSDGGKYTTLPGALTQSEKMIEQGAAIIDLGAESTRPQATPVSEYEEISRLKPFLNSFLQKKSKVGLSVDTFKPAVAQFTLENGVNMVNDVAGENRAKNGTCENSYFGAGDMYETVASSLAQICVMHNRGTPTTMDNQILYDSIDDVNQWLDNRVNCLVQEYYIPKWNIWVDPGIGFAKTMEQNLELLRHLDKTYSVHENVLLGTSRKRIVKYLVENPDATLEELDQATALTTLHGQYKGANIFRVHNIAASKTALKASSKLKELTYLKQRF